MNREIKFRAWNKTHGNMEDVFLITDCGTAFYKVGHKDFTNPMNVEKAWNDLILLQYTGRKDCDGVEIYEGDILSFMYDYDEKYSEGVIAVVSFNDNNHGGVLGWNMMNPNGTPHEFYYGCSPDENWKVIGNIYQNPELLENDDE